MCRDMVDGSISEPRLLGRLCAWRGSLQGADLRPLAIWSSTTFLVTHVRRGPEGVSLNVPS